MSVAVPRSEAELAVHSALNQNCGSDGEPMNSAGAVVHSYILLGNSLLNAEL